MAEVLTESGCGFLENPVLNSSLLQDRRVVVVSVIGKESLEHSKTECISSALQRCAFIESYKIPDSTATVIFF